MLTRALSLVVCMWLGGPAAAETTTVLMSEQDWTLFGIDGYAFTMWDDAMEFDGVCVAETMQDGNRLQYAMFFREWRNYEPDVIGLVMGQALLPGRDLAEGARDLVISSGTASYQVSGADLTSERLSFMVGAQHTPASALQMLAMMGDETMTLSETDGTLIAEFSARGFDLVLAALMDCGGISPP